MPPPYPPPDQPVISITGNLNDHWPYQHPLRRDALGKFVYALHFTLNRHSPTLLRPTAAFDECTQGSIDIRDMWDAMDQAHRDSWIPHAKRWSLPVRIAFGKFNIRRVVAHMPILDHPPD